MIEISVIENSKMTGKAGRSNHVDDKLLLPARRCANCSNTNKSS